MSIDPTLPAPPSIERCYRHPGVETGVHCTRCDRPICPDCMIPAPVGYQCPECVQEARREFRQGPGRRIAVANAKSLSATTAILAVIGAVYLIEAVSAGAGGLISGPSNRTLYDLGGMISYVQGPLGATPFGVSAGQYWRLVTAMFLHAGLIHLAFNSYALWIFGTVIEQELGRLRFLLIYFTTGFLASAASYAFGSPNVVAVGASGAIFGLFGAFVTYNYRRRQQALAQARLRQAMFLILLNAFIGFSVPSIDWRAHAGGLAAGIVAGYVADRSGDLAGRRTILLVGSVGLIAVAVALVAWRTNDIRSMLPPGLL